MDKKEKHGHQPEKRQHLLFPIPAEGLKLDQTATLCTLLLLEFTKQHMLCQHVATC
jgi:hypothetical protein